MLAYDTYRRVINIIWSQIRVDLLPEEISVALNALIPVGNIAGVTRILRDAGYPVDAITSSVVASFGAQARVYLRASSAIALGLNEILSWVWALEI